MLFDAPAPVTSQDPPEPPITQPPPLPASAELSSGDKAKARDILAAIRTLQRIEAEQRRATQEERQVLIRFGGFGPVAKVLFPDEVLLRKQPDHPFGGYKDAGWQVLGEELRSLLTEKEYDSAKRTTFNAFYTSSPVIRAMFGRSRAWACRTTAWCWSRAAARGVFLSSRRRTCASSASR